MKSVNKAVRKKDAMELLLGKPVYTDDIAPKDCLVVKLLRSPYANAYVKSINTDIAMKVPGIEAIYTYKDVDQNMKRFTCAGQTYPEPSPYDRLILDQRVRFVGDAVAIIAGETEAAVDHAMRLIKVKYQVLEPVLDMHDSKDGKILVHPEDSWKALCNVGADNKRNLCASGGETHGDLEAAFAGCSHIVEKTYHTKANQQAMMETFRAFTYMDVYGRLNVVDSTQVTFHVRRILAHALDVPKSKIRVIKPRIGGGFGAKQTVVAEVYPAIVTMKTGKPAKIIYSRYESQIASSPRHEMEVKVKIGCDDNGILQAMDVYTLSNTGAFGEHGPTTVGLSGHKSIPMYGTPKAFRFAYEPFVFGKSKEKDSREMYAQAMKFFIIFTLLAFLAVMFYLDILRHIIGRDYWDGLRVVPIVMAAEIFMGIYFNLSFWYKLIDETRWGAYFSLTGCTILILMNIFLIPKYGYIACAWAGFTGYGVAMLLSYFVGQKKYPIQYDLKAIGMYVLLAAVLYLAAEYVPIDNIYLRMAYRTVLLILFIAYVVKRDLPLNQIPILNRIIRH